MTDIEPCPLYPVPVCEACWRKRFGEEPPPVSPPVSLDEACEICGQPTISGLYLLKGLRVPT